MAADGTVKHGHIVTHGGDTYWALGRVSATEFYAEKDDGTVGRFRLDDAGATLVSHRQVGATSALVPTEQSHDKPPFN